MRRVYLLRHAKSSWKDSSLADRDRPLAARGKRAAKAVASHIEAEGIRPDLALCSPARRSRETFERVGAAIDLPADDWSAIERGSGELVAYVRPRDLQLDRGIP